ncbi:MAG: response regulator [Methylotetracoccus sp.]
MADRGGIGYRLLIVDDSPEDRAVMRALLARSGLACQTEEAGTGGEVLRRVRQSEGEPLDCILLDYSLPDGDAPQLLAELFGTAPPDYPVVVVTGYCAGVPGRAVLQAGAQEFIGKDWLTADSLRRCVENAIERFRITRDLRRSEALYRLLVEQNVDGILVHDAERRYVEANPAACRMLGYSREEILGRCVAEMVEDDEVTRIADVETRFRGGAAVSVEFRCRRKDGSNFIGEVSGSPLPGGLFLGILRDVTERKGIEEQLREADRRKDEFLATLAHELRNPLAPITSVLELMRTVGPDDPSFPRLRDILTRQTQHLVRLVDDLLEVTRISRGKIKLKKELCTVATIVMQALEGSEPLIRAAGHTVTMSLSPEALFVFGDPVRLTQVLCNLLNNSSKYMPSNGRIHVSAERSGSEAVMRVRDQGIGISAEQLPHVFDLFQQVRPSCDTSHGGLGIGLNLVRNLVELHGGRVTAHSAGLGLGSEFCVYLPLAAADAREGIAVDRPTLETARERRVLVVDDNRDAADSLALVADGLGAKVEVVYDGEAALAILGRFRPDVVLLDLGMPGMDGFEVAEQIRKSPGGRSVTLVAVSGWGQTEDRRRTLEAGFDHHLIKPARIADIQRLLAASADTGSFIAGRN